MPITASYQVRCDICLRVMGGEYDTREEAEKARDATGWGTSDGRTICPNHPGIVR